MNGSYKLLQWNCYDYGGLPQKFWITWGDEEEAGMKLEQLELGGRAPPWKKSFIEKDKRISALFERFKEAQYSLSDYLDAIKYQTGL